MLTFYNFGVDDDCVICLEKKSSTNITILSCRHSFHSTCITKWFEKDPICPLCMKPKKILYNNLTTIQKVKEKPGACCIIS